jgi:translation initiation factor IF-2
MTESKHPGEKLTVAPAKGTLSLKRPSIEQGVVKQSFSHGRTKAVVVEKVKSRRPESRVEPAPAIAPVAASAGSAQVRRQPLTTARGAVAPATAPAAPAAAKPAGGVVLRKLTEEEREARASALESAKVR